MAFPTLEPGYAIALGTNLFTQGQQWTAPSGTYAGQTIDQIFPQTPDAFTVGTLQIGATLWTGAAYDAVHGMYWVPPWGGHSSTFDNSVFRCLLSSQAWTRTRDPSLLAPYAHTSEYIGAWWHGGPPAPAYPNTWGDGAPETTHNYGGTCYIPTTDKLTFVGGNKADSNAFTLAMEYDCAAHTWATTHDLNLAGVPYQSGGITICFDPVASTPRCVMIAKDYLYEYRITGAADTRLSLLASANATSYADYQSACLHEEQYLFVQLGRVSTSNTFGLCVWELGSGSVQRMDVTLVDANGSPWDFPAYADIAPGTTNTMYQGGGICYDALRKEVVCWKGAALVGGGDNGNVLYPIELVKQGGAYTGIVRPETMTAGTLGLAPYQGVYTKFQYAADLDVFLTCNDLTEGLRAYRRKQKWYLRDTGASRQGYMNHEGGKHGRMFYRPAGTGLPAGLIGVGGDYAIAAVDSTAENGTGYSAPEIWHLDVLNNTDTLVRSMFDGGGKVQPARGCSLNFAYKPSTDEMWTAPPFCVYTSGTLTQGSATIQSVYSIGGLGDGRYVGQAVRAFAGIPAGTTFVSGTENTGAGGTLVMSAPATDTVGDQQIYIGVDGPLGIPAGVPVPDARPQGYVWHFDTRTFDGPNTAFLPPTNGWGGDTGTITEHMAYDATNDDLIRIGTVGIFERYHIPTSTWQITSLAGTYGSTGRSDVAIDQVSRELYFLDVYGPSPPALIRVALATLAVTRINLPAEWQRSSGDHEQLLCFDTRNRVVLMPNNPEMGTAPMPGIAIYVPATGAMEWEPWPAALGPVCASVCGYDESTGQMVVLGDKNRHFDTGLPSQRAIYTYDAGSGTLLVGPPTIVSFAPASAIVGSGAFALTIMGAQFEPTATGTFDGQARTLTVISATQASLAVLATDVATVGSYAVTVTNATGPNAGTATQNFAVVLAPATLTLVWLGLLRDRVGRGPVALGADGGLDGTMGVTLHMPDSLPRTVTGVRLLLLPFVGEWNSLNNGIGQWLLGAADTLDGALLNDPDTMAVSVSKSNGDGLILFAADEVTPTWLAPGTLLTVAVLFDDGSSATGTVTVEAEPEPPGPARPPVDVDLTQPPGLHARIVWGA